MALSELPHTRGCVVCGHDNPRSLKLSLHVDETTGVVIADYTPSPDQIGFEGIIHGGVLATVLDEAMVWAATWSGRRFCVCGELSVRYRQITPVGKPLRVEAKIQAVRSRLIETSSFIVDADGAIYCTAVGKYIPVPPARHAEVVKTLVQSPTAASTLDALRVGVQ